MASVAEDNIVQVWQMCENIYLQEDDLPDVRSLLHHTSHITKLHARQSRATSTSSSAGCLTRPRGPGRVDRRAVIFSINILDFLCDARVTTGPQEACLHLFHVLHRKTDGLPQHVLHACGIHIRRAPMDVAHGATACASRKRQRDASFVTRRKVKRRPAGSKKRLSHGGCIRRE